MRRIRETLRLHLQAGLSYSEIGGALKISKSVVGKYVLLARVAGVDCEVADTLSDDELEARLYRPPVPRSSHQLAPDFAVVHQELKRAGVTLRLLWEEWATGKPLAYRYTSFCIKYRAFAATQARSMRQVHLAGEKLFVDYAGGTVPIVDASTGEITQAQIFVATLGASKYTFAGATPRQTTADWIGAQVLALEFIGGVPRLIVPDQPRALVKTPDRYDPEPNRTYEEFAKHYGCAVLLVQRWILARLSAQRHRVARRPGAAAAARCTVRHQPLEDGQGQHRPPRRVRGPLLQRAAPAGVRGRPVWPGREDRRICSVTCSVTCDTVAHALRRSTAAKAVAPAAAWL